MARRRVVITGVASHWGTELARRLEREPEVDYIAGIDSVEPAAQTSSAPSSSRPTSATRCSRGSCRRPRPTRSSTAGSSGIPEPGKPARALHDINVIGTLQLLAACERTPRLERVVVRGSAAIYGCEGAAPSFFTEDLARQMPLRTRFQRDISELEDYFANFARRHPEIVCCMLRYQPEIGPGLDTPLARYLSLPVVPTQLGFDPRLQLVHADDATGALLAAIRNPVRGPVNVAPDGAISLSRTLRLARRPSIPIPHPLFEPALARLGDRLGVGRALRRRRAPPALRPRRRQHPAARGGRLRAGPTTPRSTVRDFAAGIGGRRVGPSLHPGTLAERSAGASR